MRLIFVFIAILIFYCSCYVNSVMLPIYFIQAGIKESFIDDLCLLEFTGYILGCITMLQFTGILSNKNLIIFSGIIFIISLTNIITIENQRIIQIHWIIMSACKMAFLTLHMYKINDIIGGNTPKYLFGFIFITICCELIGGIMIPIFLTHSIFKILILNCLVTCSAIFISFIEPNNDGSIMLKKSSAQAIFTNIPSITNLALNIELEILCGFSLAYSLATLYWQYEIQAVFYNFFISNYIDAKQYILTLLIAALFPIYSIVKKFNKFRLNAILLSFTLIGFSTLPLLSNIEFFNIVILAIIAISIFTSFICNIMILVDKFEGMNLKFAIILFILASSVGAILGIICTTKIINSFETLGFFISIYCTLGSLFIYYVLQVLKRKLYR